MRSFQGDFKYKEKWAIYQRSTRLLFSCSAARGPFARDTGIHRLGRLPGAELPSPQDGTPQTAHRRPEPGCRSAAFVQPPSPASSVSGSPGTPSLCFFPGAGLKHHLAVRALEHDPPFRRRMQPWLRAFAALGATCIEQRSVLFVENPSPKVRSNVFPKWLFFLTLLFFSSSYASIKMLMAHEQLRFSSPSISPSLQMVPNDYLGNPSLEPSVLTLVHTPLLAQDFKSSTRTVSAMPGRPLPTCFCYSSKKRKDFPLARYPGFWQ